MSVLDNPAWHALTSFHSAFAVTSGDARRYDVDVAPFCAMEGADGWDDLAGLPGPIVLSRSDEVVPPAGWAVRAETVGHQLVLDRLAPSAPVDVVELGAPDVPEVLALIAETKPGPFLSRTVELGRYLGVRAASGELVAMAGERMHLPGHTEVSAVCTAPSARGQGLAASLTTVVAQGILDRGELPILHVADGNPARHLYERLGFVERSVVRFTMLEAPSSS